MNERPHYFILERVMFLLCVRDELETEQTAILTQQCFFLILAGLLNRGSLSLQADSHAGP